MKPKKTKKADLNNYSTTFMLIGMVAILLFSLKIINMKTYATRYDQGELNLSEKQDEETVIVKVEEPKPKMEQPKKRELVDLKIEKNETKNPEDIFKPTEPVDSIPDVEKQTTVIIDDIDIPVPIKFVQQGPVYPGCEGKKGKALKKCLSDKIGRFVNRKFNAGIAQELGLSGERVKIITQFTIDKNGKVTDIKTRSKYKDLEKEAVKVLSALPQMKPGSQNGRKVKVIYTLPIVFNVEEE